MTTLRLYQVSLRTILELFFVVAVVLAFVYWRNVPRQPPGRFQIQVGEKSDVLYIDTATDRVWRGWTHGRNWQEIRTPEVGPKK
jgi:hypothetical protein